MRSSAILLILAIPACYGGIDTSSGGAGAGDPTGTEPAPDARTMDMVDREMISVASRVAAFKRIDVQPYPSTLGAFNIDVYASQNPRDYAKIHPETAGSGIILPAGTLIVRQVLDANGQVTKVTLMGKGPPGYDPSIGDWWFGVTDPSGVPLSDDSGMQVGRLTQCHGCHIPRAQDDYLFGVPKIDQR